MSGRKVLVTGLGVVSPMGSDLEAFWDSLCTETIPPRELDDAFLGRAHMDNRLFHLVADPGEDAIPAGGGRATAFALRAAEAALRDAGLDPEAMDGIGLKDAVIGVAMGTAAGDTDAWESERSATGGLAAPGPFPYRSAHAVAGRFGLTGPNFSVSTACSAAGYGISLACEAIRSGQADVMVAGGAESVSRVTQGCFNRLMALDPESCRPFDVDRKGTVMGEGAAVLILESEAHARKRGRRAYAELKGWGWSCDGHNPTAPDPAGIQAEAALRGSLAAAGVEPGEVDCVVPHGTGTALNDSIEGEVLARVFRERLPGLKVSPIKGKLGHGAGASAAFSCLAACLILRTGKIPPAGNLQTQDPECRLSLHRGSPLLAKVGHALVSSYAFGGNNISLVLGRPATETAAP
ncbi:MAG TPA: beta-ketoacyl-[acyl-carrier-protein] synthase family protein [Fibrobacteria bacterium]|nr:beta-ketoacyl-[acyl-carrier-protein] synthase family protein [Fibrobacteria bacterium]